MKFLKKNFLFLAPMAGYTNAECRKIFREYGADGVVSEFVYCTAVLRGIERVLEKVAFEECERPVGIQIFGSDPFEMADAALVIEEKFAPDFIDVNFGCPAPNAVHAGAGAALLKDVRAMSAIVKKMSESLKKTPLTAKMRMGWNFSEIIVPDAALALQEAGAKMITLHGRTKSQGYEGDADWTLIEKTAAILEIPLIGNGSVERRGSAELASSACAGFMIGRAALGNPWIFENTRKRIENPSYIPQEPTPGDRIRLALRYAELVSARGRIGVSADNLKFEKSQIMRFLKGAAGFKKLRVAVKDIKTLDELKVLLCEHI